MILWMTRKPATLNEQAFRRLISGQQTGPTAGMLRVLLRGLSLLYGAAISLRNLAFDLGWKKSESVDVPVISVGNLTTGGTGKTPVVAFVVQLLLQQGLRPGIVSRGYRADESGFNDEKRVLDQLCPGVPHLQNSDRVAAARQLAREYRVDVLVMDDGFQHRRLHRDLDIVLIDATCPFGYGHLLPRGLLREPPAALVRAGQVFITRADLAGEKALQHLEDQVARHIAPGMADRVARMAFAPVSLLNSRGERCDLLSQSGRSAMLVSGIGNSAAFRLTVESVGMKIVGEREFPDHYHYCQNDVDAVAQEAARLNADLLITTQKDLVKMQSLRSEAWAVEISAAISDKRPEQKFRQLLAEITTRRVSTEPERPTA